MEDFAGLIVFFIVIGLIEKFGKKSKKNRNTPDEPKAKAVQRVPSAKKTVPHTSLPVQAVKKAVATELSDVQELRKAIETLKQAKSKEKPAASAEPAKKPSATPAAAPQQLSFIDDQGCIGSSIPHAQHEGESKAEHEAHLARAAVSADTASAFGSVRGLNARDLRRAVVMSEILDKPKALRR